MKKVESRTQLIRRHGSAAAEAAIYISSRFC